MPKSFDVSQDYYAAVGLNFEALNAMQDDKKAERMIAECFDKALKDHQAKLKEVQSSVGAKNKELNAYKIIQAARDIIYPVGIHSGAKDPEARKRRHEYNKGRAQYLLQQKIAEFNKIKMPDLYAAVGLKYEDCANRYKPTMNSRVMAAVDAATKRHQDAMATSNITQREKERTWYKENLRDGLIILRNPTKRKEYDQKFAEYQAQKSLYASLLSQSPVGGAGAQQQEVEILRQERNLINQHLETVREEKGLEQTLISIVEEEKKLEEKREKIVETVSSLEKEHEAILRKEQKLEEKRDEIVSQVGDLVEQRTVILDQVQSLEQERRRSIVKQVVGTGPAASGKHKRSASVDVLQARLGEALQKAVRQNRAGSVGSIDHGVVQEFARTILQTSHGRALQTAINSGHVRNIEQEIAELVRIENKVVVELSKLGDLQEEVVVAEEKLEKQQESVIKKEVKLDLQQAANAQSEINLTQQQVQGSQKENNLEAKQINAAKQDQIIQQAIGGNGRKRPAVDFEIVDVRPHKKVKIGTDEQLSTSTDQDWATDEGDDIKENRDLIMKTRSENIAYGQHLFNIKDILKAYKRDLENKAPLKDNLYKEKLNGVNRLLEALKGVDELLTHNEVEKKIKPENMNFEQSKKLLEAVNKKNETLAEICQDFTKKLVRPSVQVSLFSTMKSIADIIAIRRTKVGWQDTGQAVLKGIVTALAYITVLPAFLTKLITKKSVESHLFKVTGREVKKGIERQMGGLEDTKKTIDHLYGKNNLGIKSPRR